MVIAHAGHWAVQALYLAPLAVFVGLLARAKLHERRDRQAGGEGGAVEPRPMVGDE